MPKDKTFDEWYKTVPVDRNDTSSYNLRRAYELAPMEQLERWRTATPEQLRDDSYHLRSVYFDPATGVGEFMKSKNHPTLKGELDFYYGDSPESREFRSKYDLDKSGEYYKYIPKQNNSQSKQQKIDIMPYEKDIYGNVIGTGGDDTSLQDAKMAGYPGYNIFDKQREAAVLTQGEIEGKTGVSLGGTPVVNTAPTGSQIANYVQGNGGMPQDLSSRPKVLGTGTGRPAMNITKDGRGNYYMDGVKTPMTVFNPNAVPTVNYGPITSTEQLAAAMGYTSPQEEERLRKASVTNQRILAIGDALRHIGNIANTVRYAPSQQFNSPVTDEIARYERGKALRDRANAALLTYQQQKERQDALQRRWENELEYKRQKADEDRKATERYRDRVLKGKEAAQKYKETKGDKELEERIRHNKAQEDTANRRVDISASRASGGGGSGSRRVKSGTGRSANGKMNYWIDVPGKGRVYYPNQTMWKQGIDYYDNEGVRYTKTPGGKEKEVPYTQRGANLGRKANNAATKGKTTAQGKGSGNGRSYSNTAALLGKWGNKK